jgi:anti-sigma factor ChrR (cupin superfamily)
MRINADFDKRVLLHADEIAWQPSPMPGVSRRPLDRIGDEVARATTIVRYEPGSAFSPHTHDGGEEFIVLDGIFSDEHGDFPAGSYIRNPPTSRHTPRSEPGCVIFVKLWQFDPDDRTEVRVRLDAAGSVADATRPGVSVKPLFVDDREAVRVEQWGPNLRYDLDAPGGAELLVLEGTLEESGERLRQHSWLRVPVGSRLSLTSGDDGAKMWIKLGHLRHVNAPSGVET